MADSKKKWLVPGIIGNILEWYEFALYGYFVHTISRLFFPVNNQALSLIATFSVFAIGFLMRPLGAVIFGHIGDRYGRKKALISAIFCMAIPTGLMGLLPDYEALGIYAAVLLTFLRLLQGLAVGGEFTGSFVYLVEHAPARQRGFYGSLTLCSGIVGVMLGSGVSALVGYLANGTTAELWAWRIPFVLGFALGLLGFYVRRSMPETPGFEKISATGKRVAHPILWTLLKSPASLLYAAGLVALPVAGFYMLFVYLSSYLTIYYKMPIGQVMLINTLTMMMLVVIIPVIGCLSDKVGRRPVLFGGALGFIFLSYPLFHLLQQASIATVFIAQSAFAILVALSYSIIPAVLVEMFPTSVRYTGLSLPYNIASALFGGTAPLIATFLIAQSENLSAPMYYLIGLALILLLLIWRLPETFLLDLEEI